MIDYIAGSPVLFCLLICSCCLQFTVFGWLVILLLLWWARHTRLCRYC